MSGSEEKSLSEQIEEILETEDLENSYEDFVSQIIAILPFPEDFSFMGFAIDLKERVTKHLRDNKLEVIQLINNHGDELIEAIKLVKIR